MPSLQEYWSHLKYLFKRIKGLTKLPRSPAWCPVSCLCYKQTTNISIQREVWPLLQTNNEHFNSTCSYLFLRTNISSYVIFYMHSKFFQCVTQSQLFHITHFIPLYYTSTFYFFIFQKKQVKQTKKKDRKGKITSKKGYKRTKSLQKKNQNL